MALSTNDTLPSSAEGHAPIAQRSTVLQQPTQGKAWSAFAEAWQEATSDNTFTLHGFRRFRTSHLLNLRFLERELAELDHQLFQAGFRTKQSDRPLDKLGLNEAKVDPGITSIDSIVNESSINKLQDLVKRYDEALISYNQIMRMETFSLADNLAHAAHRPDLNPYEMYKTRLVKADIPLKRPRTPILALIHTGLRAYWFYIRKRATFQAMPASLESQRPPPTSVTYQNTIKLAESLASFLTALTSGAFLIVPVCILSFQHSKTAHLITISISIVAFSFAISLTMRTSGPETVAASAAYAAVLVVFLSTSSDQQ